MSVCSSQNEKQFDAMPAELVDRLEACNCASNFSSKVSSRSLLARELLSSGKLLVAAAASRSNYQNCMLTILKARTRTNGGQ